jgi:hypothetical protein
MLTAKVIGIVEGTHCILLSGAMGLACLPAALMLADLIRLCPISLLLLYSQRLLGLCVFCTSAPAAIHIHHFGCVALFICAASPLHVRIILDA